MFVNDSLLLSEERYLWVCEYRLHQRNCLWWAYFKDGCEFKDFFAQVASLLPCFILKQANEHKQGMRIGDEYYHYCFSRQARTIEEIKRTRPQQRFLYGIPAPLGDDWWTSLIKSHWNFILCPQCATNEILIEKLLLIRPSYRKRFARHAFSPAHSMSINALSG